MKRKSDWPGRLEGGGIRRTGGIEERGTFYRREKVKDPNHSLREQKKRDPGKEQRKKNRIFALLHRRSTTGQVAGRGNAQRKRCEAWEAEEYYAKKYSGGGETSYSAPQELMSYKPDIAR